MTRLLLAGGGHAHLKVLQALARRPLEGWHIELVTPAPTQVYSGMLPGWVAGHYALDACSIDLRPVATRACASLVLDALCGIDADARTVRTNSGRTLAYDVLSLDIGSASDLEAIPGAAAHATPVRPLERFIEAWNALETRLRAHRTAFRVAVVGGGAGSIELALALRNRALRQGWSHVGVTLLGADPEPLVQAPEGARERVARALRQRGVAWRANTRAVAVEERAVRLDDGTALEADACWWVTGPAAPPWLRDTALALDDEGFVRVDAGLGSVSHADVYASGDVASHPGAPPRSGVYAVRAGEALARILPAACRDEPAAPWRPQARALYLLSTGDRRAIAIRGRWHAQGRWAWWWKDVIDRRFVRSFASR